MEDSKKFIAEQKSVPAIAEIAREAASLQITIDNFGEPAAIQSMQRLADLLKSISGFDDFEKRQQIVRDREKARNLAEAQTQSKKNRFFLDGYMKDHLGDAKTETNRRQGRSFDRGRHHRLEYHPICPKGVTRLISPDP